MAASRGLGVSQQDMDASRLVFVSVRDAKPKRKVAVPISDSSSWEQFCRQVVSKLKLSGVAGVYLASSGEQVTRLDQLQDIDELLVVEGAGGSGSGSRGGGGEPSTSRPGSASNGYAAAGGPGGAPLAQNPSTYMQRTATADNEISPMQSSRLAAESDLDAKYAKRQSSVTRTMKRVFPSLFSQPSLPLTSRDLNPMSPVEQVRRRIRRRRRSCTDPRNLLIFFTLLSCMGTLVFVWTRTAGQLP